ncbi:MAG TPA: DUF3108 domain-containing protein [Methylophilus sp.]|nr:DUF3108 domain-containing protein [Methylophilus sp.]
MKKEMHLIEARLQMPKIVLPKAEEALLEELPEPTKPEPVKTEEQTAQPPEPVTEPVSEPENPLPELPSPVVEPSMNHEPQPQAQAEAVAEPVQQTDAGLVINENAYRYVETYFDVSTKIGGRAEGKAKMIYDLMDEKRYKITSLTEADGLVAIFISDLVQESEGELTKTGLQPQRYLYQYGKKDDKTYLATFDWASKTLLLKSSKGEKTEPLVEGAQDLLSFMYQFMFVPPLETMQIPITNGKKLRIYDYQFDGEELLTGELGEVNTLHISRGGQDPEERFELWLAPSYQNIPIKIRKTEKDGKVYEMTATRINTNRPVLSN